MINEMISIVGLEASLSDELITKIQLCEPVMRNKEDIERIKQQLAQSTAPTPSEDTQVAVVDSIGGTAATISFNADQTSVPATIHRDMTERAFQRFETELSEVSNYLAHQPGGFCEINMAKYTLSPGTFVNRIQSAVSGYRRFGYKSSMIPVGFNLMWLKFSATKRSVIVRIKPCYYMFVLDAFPPQPAATFTEKGIQSLEGILSKAAPQATPGGPIQ